MDLTPPPRLPAKLESAVQRIRMAARTAAEHTVDSLGLAALATHQVLQRDALLGAQFALNRKLAIFALVFNEALDTDVARQAGSLTPTAGPTPTADTLVASWDALTLVEDHEVELQISADRFALEISHACEWEIRELDAYMGTLLGLASVDHDRNPLRAEVIGQAMLRAIEAVSDQPEVRKVLSTEIARSLAHAMRKTYGEVVADMRQAGIRPVGLALRPNPSRVGSLQPDQALSGKQHGERAAGPPAIAAALHSRQGRFAETGPPRGAFAPARNTGPAPSLGQVDGEMMNLIRRLAGRSGNGPAPAPGHAGRPHPARPGAGRYRSQYHGPGSDDDADEPDGYPTHAACGVLDPDLDPDSDPGSDPDSDSVSAGPAPGTARLVAHLAAPNLILVHRDALRQAASGGLDHWVIDVIAGLFVQILSDPKVPPQVARQIARLQLPVLRAALGDKRFFSSRRHPVRRFINRIASLGAAVDDFADTEGLALLARVSELVQDVVDGDFEQIAVYEDKLAALEAFIAAQSRDRLQALGHADQLLARKELVLQVHQRFEQALLEALQDLPLPGYLHDFLGKTWSRAIAHAALAEGNDAALTQRLRGAGRELVLSVQPKGSPERRQQFLRKLPQLMKDLHLGLDQIACPEADRRQFFARLLPAHAESLKGQSQSTLEHNLLARRLDQALAIPVPAAQDMPRQPSIPAQKALQAAATPAAFTPAEARAVGLLDDAAVDWAGRVRNDRTTEPELTAVDIDIDGLPAPEPIEPTRGKPLADHVQLGFGYELQLQGSWEKARLSHVSAGRSFFVFTYGAGLQRTVSMTHRMLVRLCESGRLRALESAYLLERATARARRQLAAIGGIRH